MRTNTLLVACKVQRFGIHRIKLSNMHAIIKQLACLCAWNSEHRTSLRNTIYCKGFQSWRASKNHIFFSTTLLTLCIVQQKIIVTRIARIDVYWIIVLQQSYKSLCLNSENKIIQHQLIIGIINYKFNCSSNPIQVSIPKFTIIQCSL